MPTMEDVAKRAGVAPITVSRVLAGSAPVSEDTRNRVLAAVSELGYVPNALARSFRSKKTHTVALVLSDITNPFWTTVARGAEDTARQHGFRLILCNTDESKHMQDEYIQLLLQNNIDGIAIVPASTDPEPLNLIQAQGAQVVVLDRRAIPGVHSDVVRGESEDAAYRLIDLLLSLGHQRIAILAGPMTVSTAIDRLAGYQRALNDAGLDSEALVYIGEYTVESGYVMAQQALTAEPAPTALFATNNFIATGAMRAARDAGLRIPDDLALVAFDAVPDHLVVEPFLTVAAQPAYEIGKRAIEILIDRIEERAPQAYEEIVLPTEILISKSSGQALHPTPSATRDANPRSEGGALE